MPNFAYKFFYNSDGLVFSETTQSFIARKQDHTHYPTLDGYLPYDNLTLAWEGTIDVNVHGDDEAAIERFVCTKLYEQFNAPYQRPNEYAGPSMSIGDVVVLFPGTEKEVAYSVAKVGFDRAGVRSSLENVRQQPTRWVRDAKQVREYLKAKLDEGCYALTDEEEVILYGR